MTDAFVPSVRPFIDSTHSIASQTVAPLDRASPARSTAAAWARSQRHSASTTSTSAAV